MMSCRHCIDYALIVHLTLQIPFSICGQSILHGFFPERELSVPCQSPNHGSSNCTSQVAAGMNLLLGSLVTAENTSVCSK